MSEMRYFRAKVAVYEEVRSALDAAWGYPNPSTKTDTAIPPAAVLPADEQGRVYLAIEGQYCDFLLPSEMLPGLLATGAVEEISEDVYRARLPPDLPMGE